MVEVNLWSGLRSYTGGDLVISVEASTISEMLEALVAAHPSLGPVIDAGVSVVVDGEVFAANREVPISPSNEIYLMRMLRGG